MSKSRSPCHETPRGSHLPVVGCRSGYFSTSKCRLRRCSISVKTRSCKSRRAMGVDQNTSTFPPTMLVDRPSGLARLPPPLEVAGLGAAFPECGHACGNERVGRNGAAFVWKRSGDGGLLREHGGQRLARGPITHGLSERPGTGYQKAMRCSLVRHDECSEV